MGRKAKNVEIPDRKGFGTERPIMKSRCRRILKGTAFTLVLAVAAGALAATLCLPFLRICGTSMAPALQDGEVVCCVKTSEFETGDIVAYDHSNKLLIQRVIGHAGDWIDIDAQGNVYVNGALLEEPYLTEKALGSGDLELPCQVPEGKLFVLGDHRSASVDSRYTAVGCISQEQIVGKVVIRIWPLSRIRFFE